MTRLDRLQLLEPFASPANETYLEPTPDGCPRVRVLGSLLSLNGEIALGYLDLGYRPIPLIRDKNGSWIPAVKWVPFQDRTPVRQQIIEWWMKYPCAGIALICGGDAGLLVSDVDPRHGGVDPKLSAPACFTPRGGIHYHFIAPATIPKLDGPGLEWLGEGHMARVPPTPGYRWLNGGLPPRISTYKPENLPPRLRPRRSFPPALVTSQQGDLCEVLSQALGREIRPGTRIECFCHHDTEPSLAIYPDHGFCFSQWRYFTLHQVLKAHGLAHLFHIEGVKHLYEANAPEGSVRSIAPTGLRLSEEKARLSGALKDLGFVDKAKEVDMCGQWVTKVKTKLVKTRTCEDCGATFVVQSRCRSRFCPECTAVQARDSLQGKETVFKDAKCAIVQLPLPSLAENTSAAFSKAKKEVSGILRRLLGRECGPAYHKILTGCRNGQFRWELVVLAAAADTEKLEVGWPYGKAKVLKELTPPQAMTLYMEVEGKPPEWEAPKDLATLEMMLYRQRLKGSHGEAHGNSRGMKARPKEAKAVQHCPVCGSLNLSRPVYRDSAGVRWVNAVPLWFAQSSDRSPPSQCSDGRASIEEHRSNESISGT